MPYTIPKDMLDRSTVGFSFKIMDYFVYPIYKCLTVKNKLGGKRNSESRSHQAKNMISYRNFINELELCRAKKLEPGESIDFECVNGVDCYVFRSTSTQIPSVSQPMNDDDGEEKKEKVVFYYHGGGWCICTAKVSPAATCLMLAKTLNVAVVSVEYSLSPENTFTDDLSKRCAFTDCYNATVGYLSKHAGNISSYGLTGDSSGGNLTLTVGLKMTNCDDFSSKGLPFPAFLAPIYPVTQCLSFGTSSYYNCYYNKDCSTGAVTNKTMVEFAASYGVGNFTKKMVNFLIENPDCLRKDLNDSESGLLEKLEDANSCLDNYSTTCGSKNKNVDENNNFKSVNKSNNPIQTDNNSLKADLAKLQSSALNPYFSPLFASDLMVENVIKKIKKIRFICCEYDVLKDDTLLMYEKFMAAFKKIESDNRSSENNQSDDPDLTKTVVPGGTHISLTSSLSQPEEYPGHLAYMMAFIEGLKTDF